MRGPSHASSIATSPGHRVRQQKLLSQTLRIGFAGKLDFYLLLRNLHSPGYGRHPDFGRACAAQNSGALGYGCASRINVIHNKDLAASHGFWAPHAKRSANVFAALMGGQASLGGSFSLSFENIGAQLETARLGGSFDCRTRDQLGVVELALSQLSAI